jgi:P pilus assembly chaperone PapD
VTLTATPSQGSSFTGWSGGGCSGTGACRVTLNSDQTATATFAADPAGTALISRVTVTGPARVRKSKPAGYKVQISNSGTVEATGVKLKVSGMGVSAGASPGSIPAGSSRTIEVKLKPKKTGRVKLTFQLTSGNAGSRTVTKAITVRR